MKFYITIIFISLFIFFCGSGNLTKDEAKSIVLKEIKNFIEPIAKNNTSDIQKKLDHIKIELENMVEISELKVKEENTFVKVVLKMGGDKLNTEINFTKSDSNWKIKEIRLINGKWLSYNDALSLAKTNLNKRLNRGKEISTMGDIKSLGSSIEMYITENAKAPEADSMNALKKILHPLYIAIMMEKDSWGNTFFYKYKKDYYQLRSAGIDGKMEDWRTKGDDIIFMNGEYIETQTQLDKRITEWEKIEN